jgi:hypothetical protein
MEIFNVFGFRKPFQNFFSEVTPWTLIFENVDDMKRFFQNHKTLNIPSKKCYEAEILYGARHLNCGWEFEKRIKKVLWKKAHAEDRTWVSVWCNGYFQISSLTHIKF